MRIGVRREGVRPHCPVGNVGNLIFRVINIRTGLAAARPAKKKPPREPAENDEEANREYVKKGERHPRSVNMYTYIHVYIYIGICMLVCVYTSPCMPPFSVICICTIYYF